MLILHHLDMVYAHGAIKDYKIDEALGILDEQNELFIPIIKKLNYKKLLDLNMKNLGEGLQQEKIITLEEIEHQLEVKTRISRKFTKDERDRRLKSALKIPKLISVTTTVYERNADVVAEILERANGICERCGVAAPFIRASNGTPYLEVHHRKRLSDGGEDIIDNAIAVCPNCHREAHFCRKV